MLLAVAVPVAAMLAAAARHLREALELGWENLALFTAIAEAYTLPWLAAYLVLHRLGRHGAGKRPADSACRAGWTPGAVVGAAVGLFAGWVFAFTVVMGSRESAILFVIPPVVALLVYLPAIAGAALGAACSYLLGRLLRGGGRVEVPGTKTPRW